MHPIVSKLLLTLSCFCLLLPSPATPSSTTPSPPILFSLVNTQAKVTDEIAFTPSQWDQNRFDLIFKTKISPHLTVQSWQLVVVDLQRKIIYRKKHIGKVPTFIHWNGFFDIKHTIQVGKKYLARLIIQTPQKKYTSFWTAFKTKRLSSNISQPITTFTPISRWFLIPHTALLISSTSAAGIKQTQPLLYGKIKLFFSPQKNLSLSLKSTSNIFHPYSQGLENIFYSRFEIGYAQWVWGTPKIAPLTQAQPSPPSYLELQTSLFFSTLRSYDPIPSQSSLEQKLPRNYYGLALSIRGGQYLLPFRIEYSLSLGYSVLRANLWTLGIETKLLYEWPTLALGPTFWLQWINGFPSTHEFNALTSINALLWGTGLHFTFKL